MNKKLLLPLVLISFLFGNSFSQGYMGHKIELRYNGLFYPQFTHITDSKGETELGINYTHDFSIGYVKNRSTSYFLGFQKYNLPIVYNAYGEYSNGIDRVKDILKSNSFTLGVRFYSSSSIAPIGFYNQLSLSIKSYTLEGDKGYHKLIPSVSWGLGKQVLIAGNVLFDFGIQSSMNLYNFLDYDDIMYRAFLRDFVTLKFGLTYLL